jgi:NAD(P)-dependent dehydrogenase (short-subunit alcohol dehydrogenase family)
MRSAIAKVAKQHDIVGIVNNAGRHTDGPSATLPIEALSNLFEINATSVMIGCQQAFPHMSEKGGLIVNVGSFFDKLGVKRNLAYCASKAAVGAMSRVLAVEWAKHDIQVVTVAPGYIVTDLNEGQMKAGPLREYLEGRIPGGKPADADDVGRFVASLYASRTPFLTGETIYLDGGQGIAH